MRITRRGLGQLLYAAAPALVHGASSGEVRLTNAAMEIVLAVEGGRVTSRRLVNRKTGETVALPVSLFSLEFYGGQRFSAQDFRATVAASTPGRLELRFDSTTADLQVRVIYELRSDRAYLRKRMSIRTTGGAERRLLAVELEDWRGVHRGWASMTADPLKCGSHPIYCDTWWAGVEFVAAFNQYSGEGFLLRSRPGGRRIGTAWTSLRPIVIGTTEAGAARDTFLRYLDDVRLSQPRFVTCYNSWWTLPKVITERNSRALIEQLKASLYDRNGVFFDFVTMDMGWSHPRTIWEIDRSILPDGFGNLRRILRQAGGRLGLWMSPSEQYPPVCDYDWAETSGYVVLREQKPGSREIRQAVSLADPRYREQAKAALDYLIRRQGVEQIKYDGLQAREEKAHHDLLPGDDSVEPLAEYALELLKVSKQANPELITEPTFFNSHYTYISPWLLMYSDTIWGNTSDCPLGIGPAPEYRESHTNAREYLIFRSLDEVWVPQNAVQYFDIVQVDAKGGFPNHAAMAVGRGRFFLSTYINPQLMTPEDWRVYAGLIRWARNNQDLLRNTKVLPSRVEMGEPYVYAHWLGKRGVLTVRNPSNHTQDFSVDLRKAGAPPDLKDAVCYTQYPYRRGLAGGLSADSPLALRLAPWEVLFLEIVQREELTATVTLGARWYQDGDATAIVPDAGIEQVRVLKAGGGEQSVAVESPSRPPASVTVVSKSIRPVPTDRWLTHQPIARPYFLFHYPVEPGSAADEQLRSEARNRAKPETVETCSFDFHLSVIVPAGARNARLLLLIEFPGRSFRPTECTATVNGIELPLASSDSSNRTGYFAATKTNPWKDMARHESQWCWYTCEVGPGDSDVEFRGKAGHPAPRFRLWRSTTYDLGRLKTRIAALSTEADMPQYEPEYEHEGAQVML